MRILFQGDSITDANRGGDPEGMGYGYPKYATELLQKYFAEQGIEVECINKGISGNRAESLVERWQKDAIDIKPDIISILIGINDTWHRAGERNWMPNSYFESCYRVILQQIKDRVGAKIIILEQFLLDAPDKEFFRVDLDPKIQITRKLAREYADAFIPLDGLFAQAALDHEPFYFSGDGVHPNENGSRFIAELYLDAVKKVLAK